MAALLGLRGATAPTHTVILALDTDDVICQPLPSDVDDTESEALPARVTPDKSPPSAPARVTPECDAQDQVEVGRAAARDQIEVVVVGSGAPPGPVEFATSGCLLDALGDRRAVPRPSARRPRPSLDVPSTLDYERVVLKNTSDRPATAHRNRIASRTRSVDGARAADGAPAEQLVRFLQARGLGQYAPALAGLGARKVADLALLSDDDLDEIGVPPDERISLRVSVG